MLLWTWYIRSNLGIKFCVEEVVMRIREAEGGSKESFCSWAFGRIAGVPLVTILRTPQSADATYIVKQSYMKLRACGVMFLLTSSGIGGAWFKLPSL